MNDDIINKGGFMSKKRRKKTNKIYKIISILMIVISVLTLCSIIYLNIIPDKYLTMTIGIIAIIDIISLFLASYKRISKKLRTFNMFINIILIIIMGVGIFYIFKTNDFLKNMNVNYKTLNYSVIVLKNNDFEDIDDLNNKIMGYFDNDNEGTDESLAEIKKKINTKNTKFNDLNDIKEALLENEVDAILLEESYHNMLKDVEYENDNSIVQSKSDNNEKMTEFDSKTKVIYSFSIKVKIAKITKSVDNVTKDTFNIYISGLDTYGKVSSVSRTDVNMVITVNPKTHQILLTSIPRDYYVQLHGTTGLKDKLTHSGIYGIDMSVKTIEDIFKIDINYYFKVNFTSLIKIVDKLNGVDVYSDYTFTSKDKYHYTKGYNHVNGKQALSFVRERKNLPGGDRQRIKDQQAMIDAIFRKAINSAIIVKYSSLLNSLEDTFITNMSSKEITNLIKMQLDENAKWTITTNSLEGNDSKKRTYSIPSRSLYVMEPDEESVNNAINLINSVTNGKKLDASFDSNSSDIHSVTSVKTNSNKSKIAKSNKTSTNKKQETDKKTVPKENNDKTEESKKENNSVSTETEEPKKDNNSSSTEVEEPKKDNDLSSEETEESKKSK